MKDGVTSSLFIISYAPRASRLALDRHPGWLGVRTKSPTDIKYEDIKSTIGFRGKKNSATGLLG